VKFARARQFIEAVAAHDFEAATELLDPDVETVTPRGTVRGIAGMLRATSLRARMRSLVGVKLAKWRTSVTLQCA
jgi:hypothetical protein